MERPGFGHIFEKIDLKAGESKTVEFKITPKDLAFVGIENQWITEPGIFTVEVDELRGQFEYQPKN